MKSRKWESSDFRTTTRQSLGLAGGEASAAVDAAAAVDVGDRLSRLRRDGKLGTGSFLPRWVAWLLSGSELEGKSQKVSLRHYVIITGIVYR